MATSVDLLILWHMHQPSYVHPRTGRPVLPWVRLHACSGYLDMARALERFPGVHVTVNFVPSLLEQLEGAAQGGDRADEIARLAELPVDALGDEERARVLARSFSVAQRAIDARPRFAELKAKDRARDRFTDGDLRDLQCLFLLGWLGFAAREDEPAIDALDQKGRAFTEDDKATLLRVVREAAAAVVPAWRRLMERGQVELSSSPYYHPIVPLLVDSDAARRSRPDDPLPHRFAWPADAREQIARARAHHERAFGAPPRGMWPPEGCLSPEAVTLYAEQGVRWLAGDEETLVRSLGEGGSTSVAAAGASAGWGLRGGELQGGDERPHTRSYHHSGVDLVFRDRGLSDKIGFEYARWQADHAVGDLLHQARARAPEGGIVGLFLDGENCWDGYARRGADFLETLYRRLEAEAGSGLRARTISESLAERGAGPELERLHSGSWIHATYRVWIGDPVKNRAWDALARAREALARAESERGHEDEGVLRARDSLLVAQGSDWFWWYGEPNHTSDEPLFDDLFRSHLAAAYEALGLDVPAAIASSI